jgi:lipoprotein-anchoring transpeptidase ErfK/SrfK
MALPPSSPQPPGFPQHSGQQRNRRFLVACAFGGVVALVLVVISVAWFTSFGGEKAAAPPPPQVAAGPPPPAAQPFSPDLPESTTHSVIDAAPLDPGPPGETEGHVVHPRQEIGVYSAPGAPAFGRIGPEQIGPTWLPVIAEQPGWVQVLLPSKPNGSTGWLSTEALDRATTPYLVRVHLRSLSMELFTERRLLGEWTVGIGKTSHPTPPGRTFLLGSFSDNHQKYSPVILPLGTHSPTLDSFGGGPGTVAIHTWPTDDVFGTRSSDGCIRVPSDALDQLTEVPLGTLVLVDEQ